jgi:hypothetical protein
VFEETGKNYPRSFEYAKAQVARWSTTIILLSKESRVGSNNAYNQNTWSWICGFGDDQVIFMGLCIMWGRKNVIMDCPFVPFHIKKTIARHVELQNVVRTLIDQPHEQESRIHVVQNWFRSMELGSQLGP